MMPSSNVPISNGSRCLIDRLEMEKRAARMRTFLSGGRALMTSGELSGSLAISEFSGGMFLFAVASSRIGLFQDCK